LCEGARHPGVPIRRQCETGNACSTTSSLEVPGPSAGTTFPEVWEKGVLALRRRKQRLHCASNANEYSPLRLRRAVSRDFLLPLQILCIQRSDVALAATTLQAQFVKVATFAVRLVLKHSSVLRFRDGSSAIAATRPCRPGQTVTLGSPERAVSAGIFFIRLGLHTFMLAHHALARRNVGAAPRMMHSSPQAV
jgi:hypothetical protein